MSNHTPEPQPQPTPQSHEAVPILSLDAHTRQFFDPADWEGAVEAVFYLDVEGLTGRRFRGRVARFCDGQWLAVIQGEDEGGGGEAFVRRFPLPWEKGQSAPAPRDVAARWAQLLSPGRCSSDCHCPAPVYPELAGFSGVARLHFDQTSGFGVLVCSLGRAYLVKS